MERFNKSIIAILILIGLVLCGCGNLKDLVPRDTSSLLIPRFQRSEIFGFVAGLGTTFAAVPDLIAMLKRRSSVGMNPRMAVIMGVFQILWVYYGLLILSRPVIAWNIIAVVINFLSVGAYFHFRHKENGARLLNAKMLRPLRVQGLSLLDHQRLRSAHTFRSFVERLLDHQELTAFQWAIAGPHA